VGVAAAYTHTLFLMPTPRSRQRVAKLQWQLKNNWNWDFKSGWKMKKRAIDVAMNVALPFLPWLFTKFIGLPHKGKKIKWNYLLACTFFSQIIYTYWSQIMSCRICEKSYFLIDFGLYVKQYSLHSKRSDGQIQMFFKKSFQVWARI